MGLCFMYITITTFQQNRNTSVAAAVFEQNNDTLPIFKQRPEKQ
jgi:hypothetical protein